MNPKRSGSDASSGGSSVGPIIAAIAVACLLVALAAVIYRRRH